MANIFTADRLSALDAMFLHVENLSSPMHVGMVCRIEGAPLRKPNGAIDRERLFRVVQSRLDTAPRFRQRVIAPPLGPGRPMWVDDPHFNIAYHVRFTGLPRPGGAAELKLLAGRVLSQMLDRTRPLWEMYWVDGLENDEIGLVWKIHHCMVDGVSGVEVATLLFDFDRDAPEQHPPKPWVPQPHPKLGSLFSRALSEQAALSREWLKEAREAFVNPEAMAQRLKAELEGVGTWLGKGIAPKTCINLPIGPHRRVEWITLPLAPLKGVKNARGGTLNDVVLAVVAGAMRRFLSHRGERVNGVELHVGIPVNVRRDSEKGTLGNKVSAIATLLPVGERDALRRYDAIRARTESEKNSHAAQVAEALTHLPAGPPVSLIQQVVRMQWAQRLLNLVVTNVPGPQAPLYVSGARLLEVAPYLPLGPNVALGVAALSYDGTLGIGLIGDYDVMDDLDVLALHFREAFDELVERAGGTTNPRPPRKRPRPAHASRAGARGAPKPPRSRRSGASAASAAAARRKRKSA